MEETNIFNNTFENPIKKFKVNKPNKLKQLTTLKGNQIKWFKDNYFIKADTNGYESIAELITSILLKHTKTIDYVEYNLCEIETEDDLLVDCYSENYIKDDNTSLSILKYLTEDEITKLSKYRDKEHVRYFLDIFNNKQNITFNMEEYLSKIFLIDTLILNEDRHLNNINLILTEDNKILPAPIFDNGLFLLSRTSKYGYERITDELFNSVKAKPFNNDFHTQLNYFNWKPLIIDYENLIYELNNTKPEFKKMEFDRAKYILIQRLEKERGYLWI